MGIKTNNLIVSGKTTAPTQEQEVSLSAEEHKIKIAGGTGTKLVVDGKVKNISKKSAFLLDMLTLDDDQPK